MLSCRTCEKYKSVHAKNALIAVHVVLATLRKPLRDRPCHLLSALALQNSVITIVLTSVSMLAVCTCFGKTLLEREFLRVKNVFVGQTELLLRHSQSVGYFNELLFCAIFVFVLVELFKPMTCLGDNKRTHQCAKVSIFSRNAICSPYILIYRNAEDDWNIYWPFTLAIYFTLAYLIAWEAAFKNLCASISIEVGLPGRLRKGSISFPNIFPDFVFWSFFGHQVVLCFSPFLSGNKYLFSYSYPSIRLCKNTPLNARIF